MEVLFNSGDSGNRSEIISPLIFYSSEHEKGCGGGSGGSGGFLCSYNKTH